MSLMSELGIILRYVLRMHAQLRQMCSTLYNPMNFSPPGSSVHGILQARILRWVCHFLLQGTLLTPGLSQCLL